ncbi:MAG TPA: bleomycin resistance protein, partial [Ignavibacteria bacterium]|nr:bleomycin resistance protein [Ignavibacteria bacterium]
MKTGKITGSAPILLVSDIVNSAEWYKEKLGFSYDKLWGEPPVFCILERDGFRLMLSQVKDKNEIKPHWKIVEKMWNVYFWVDDAESMYKEFQKRG